MDKFITDILDVLKDHEITEIYPVVSMEEVYAKHPSVKTFMDTLTKNTQQEESALLIIPMILKEGVLIFSILYRDTEVYCDSFTNHKEYEKVIDAVLSSAKFTDLLERQGVTPVSRNSHTVYHSDDEILKYMMCDAVDKYFTAIGDVNVGKYTTQIIKQSDVLYTTEVQVIFNTTSFKHELSSIPHEISDFTESLNNSLDDFITQNEDKVIDETHINYVKKDNQVILVLLVMQLDTDSVAISVFLNEKATI